MGATQTVAAPLAFGAALPLCPADLRLDCDDPSTSDGYPAAVDDLVLCGEDLLRVLVADRRAGSTSR